MPASSVQRGEQGRVIFFFFFSELGFTMNVDWYQEATLGPQSLLKPWQPSRGAPTLQPRESHAGSLSGARELHGALGVIIFSRTLKLIVPWWAIQRTIGMFFPVCGLGTLIHLYKAAKHTLLTLMVELGTQPFDSLNLHMESVSFQPSLPSTYCHTLNSFI